MLALDAAFWVVCLVLVAAGATKLADPTPLAQALNQIAAPPRPAVVARLLGGLEVLLGGLGLAVGGTPVAVAVAVVYAGFTLVVLLARRRGLASCGCFGSYSAAPSVLHAVSNAASAAVALAAAVASPSAVADAIDGRSALASSSIVGLVLAAAVLVVVVDTRPPGATVRGISRSRGNDGRS